MLNHLGFVATGLTIAAPTNRTCRLKTATPKRLRELIASNLDDLERVLQFNADHRIHLYRISSDLIPFASHPINSIPWWDENAERFERMARLLRLHKIRVTMHPGQFTVLNSTNPKTVASSIAEIAWHVRLLQQLETGPASKIVIHVGGAFGDKPSAMRRFSEVVATLPESFHDRLVIENDEHIFSVEDVLELSHQTGLPMIYDNLHDEIHSGRTDGPSRWLGDVFATWKTEDGTPKVHFSQQAQGQRTGHHSDFVDPDFFASTYLFDTPSLPPFDCMLECKQKDVALIKLREALALRGFNEAARPV
jgi:UV DNA damage endonuclease